MKKDEMKYAGGPTPSFANHVFMRVNQSFVRFSFGNKTEQDGATEVHTEVVMATEDAVDVAQSLLKLVETNLTQAALQKPEGRA